MKNYLVQHGFLAIPDFPQAHTESHTATFPKRSGVKKYYAPTGGMIQSRVSLGTSVNARERLYQILSFDKQDKLPILIDVRAPQAGIIFDLSTNHAVNEGEYVLSIRSVVT